MRKTYPLAEAKKQFSRLVAEIENGYDRILITKKITKNGVEKAVLLSAEEIDGLYSHRKASSPRLLTSAFWYPLLPSDQPLDVLPVPQDDQKRHGYREDQT